MASPSAPNDDSASYVKAQPSGGADPWTAQGAHAAQRLLEVTEIDAPDDILQALEQKRVIVRRRLMLFNETPVEITDSYYPLSVASGTALAEERKVRGGATTARWSSGNGNRSSGADAPLRFEVFDEA